MEQPLFQGRGEGFAKTNSASLLMKTGLPILFFAVIIQLQVTRNKPRRRRERVEV
jgi:hypothetical protein